MARSGHRKRLLAVDWQKDGPKRWDSGWLGRFHPWQVYIIYQTHLTLAFFLCSNPRPAA
jgi:hypothetical protein